MSALIPPDDRGFLLADGLFETVLADHGRLVWFEAHAARLARGCEALGLPAPVFGDLRAAANEALIAAGLAKARAAVRLTWTAGGGGRGLERPAHPKPRLIATTAAAPKPDRPVRLAISAVRRNAGSPASRLKSLAYLDNVLARREALERGADEAVMPNTAGEIACAAAANLFWIAEDRLFTPALDCGVLEGIARAKILAAARRLGVVADEVHANEEALATADTVFISNSLIGVRPAVSIDGRRMSISRLCHRLAVEVDRAMAD